MNCCDYQCTQGKDCPVRKHHQKLVNDAYINANKVIEDDPTDDLAGTVKGLIAVIAVASTLGVLAFNWWRP